MTAKYEAFFDKINKFIETYINNTKNRTGNSKNNVTRKKTQKRTQTEVCALLKYMKYIWRKSICIRDFFGVPLTLI